jgi:hypothetical protein
VTVLNAPGYTFSPDPTDQQSETIWTFVPSNWQFDGTDFTWVGPTQSLTRAQTQDDGGDGPVYPPPNFDESASEQMMLSGRTFITPQATFTLAGQLDQYVKTHSMRDPGLETLLENLDQLIDQVASQDILSQRLSGMLGQMIQRSSSQTIAPSGSITNLLGNAQHGIPMPFPDDWPTYLGANWAFAPLGGTFFVINELTVVDAFGRSIDVTLSNYSTAPPVQGTDYEDYFYPIAGSCLQSPTGQSPSPGKGASPDPTSRMLALPPRATQPSRLAFTLLSNDGTDTDISLLAGANPVCGWVVPNHLDRSLALYAPDGTAWGELYLSQHVNGTYIPSWQPDPTNPLAPSSVSAIPNPFVRAMLEALWSRTDNGTALSELLSAIDQSLWTINPLGDRNDLDLDVLVGRPLAIVRAELTLGLNGLPVTSQDWWNLFPCRPPDPPPGDGTQPVELAAIDGGIDSYLWGIRLGSQSLRDDGLIGYFADNATSPGDTYSLFSVETLPAELQTSYLQQIAPSNYPQLRFVDDTVTTPDPTQQQICRLTMLVDPRGSVHAFSGLLPVVSVGIPDQFVTPALKAISYLFRAGPFLTIPSAVRVPRPAESKGVWTWYDRVLDAVTALTPSDGNATIATTPPLVKEGWLKFTPNPPHSSDGDSTTLAREDADARSGSA